MFHFRLQSILKVRERMVRIRQKEFSEVLARQQGLDAEIVSHEEDLSRASTYIDKTRRTGPTIFALDMFGHFQRRMKSEIELLAEQKREEAQELEAKRKTLVEAKRAQKALEILRDKERTRYEKEMNRRERKTMDEVATNYHILHSR